MSKNEIRLESLRETAEESARYVSIAYRLIYIAVAVGLFWTKTFWPWTIGFLLAAIGFEVIEYVGSIISWYLCYLKLRRAGKKDDDFIEKPSFANIIYWVCWILKVLCTVGIVVSIGYELFSLIK
jgi:hypothetical protein